MEYNEILKICGNEKFFSHPINNNDNLPTIEGFSIDHRKIENTPLLLNTIHFHKYFEMEFVLSGTAEHLINGQTIQIKKGYICLLNRNDFHTYNLKQNEKLELFNIAFDENHISPWVASQLIGKNKVMHCFLEDASYFKMFYLMNILLSEFKQTDNNFKTIRKSLLNIILINFIRSVYLEKDNSNDTNVLVRKALLYIDEHFLDEDLSLQTLSEKLEITPNYLGKKIKENIGITFNDYITQRKLEHALKLLNQNKLTINSISKACGFASSSYFILQFKKQYHMTPKEYIININKT